MHTHMWQGHVILPQMNKVPWGQFWLLGTWEKECVKMTLEQAFEGGTGVL